MEERVLAVADGIYCWEGPKRKATLFSGKLGRVVLTDRRFLFLSTGKHDITARKLAAGAAGGLSSGLATTQTDHLDESALGAAGSLALPLGHVTTWELKGMFKFLTVGYDGPAGKQHATFAPKNGGMPDGAGWVDAIGRAKAELGAEG